MGVENRTEYRGSSNQWVEGVVQFVRQRERVTDKLNYRRDRENLRGLRGRRVVGVFVGERCRLPEADPQILCSGEVDDSEVSGPHYHSGSDTVSSGEEKRV